MEIVTYFCQMVTNRLDMMRANLERAFPYFDKFVIVDGGSTDGSVEWLREQDKVELVEFRWCDDFPKSRNQYLNKVGEIRGNDEISICCVADDDEFYSQFAMENIKNLSQQMVESSSNQLAIRCRSVSMDREGVRTWESLDDFWKPLIFLWETGIHYADTKLHEALQQPSGLRQARLQDFADTDHEILYEHIKQENVIWPRGMRNFYTFGGGPNLGPRQPLWMPFRRMLAQHGQFQEWNGVEAYLEAGNIAQEIKDWFVKYRLEGTSTEEHGIEHEGRQDGYDGSSEIRECFLTYFVWYHPEELPAELLEKDKSYKDYAHEAKKIHGDDATIGLE
jgi:glycosyltransferase involved in cell wall biosynthesis